MSGQRQRIDVWLYRARLAKTRGAAARLANEGGVRLSRDGQSRRIDKPSAELSVGDVLVLPQRRGLIAIEVRALGVRRGPSPEARGLYVEVDADALA
jgi:ribosome-associated heat shock protein Hsp15